MPATTNSQHPPLSDYRCFYCFAKAFGQLIENEQLPLEAKNSFTRQMAELYCQSGKEFSAPKFSQELHTVLKQYTHNPDPYSEIKKKSNDLALGMYPRLREQVLNSSDPFGQALRLAIAGNVIDYAVHHQFDVAKTIEDVLSTGLAIDHSDELQKALRKAKRVLYLGDNAGEIVFDKLFVEAIMHPLLVYAVRGGPVVNDATMEDALYCGLDKVADVISNGYDAPSTIIEHCSPAFRDVFEHADVIISKGQGNFEGLWGKTEKPVFFLLMAKCNVIADALQVQKGDFVVQYNRAK